MNLDYQYLLEGNFHPESRVWVYQSSRLFSLNEAFEVEDILKQFTGSWLSHETASGVSGCSTDTSVRLIKDIEQRFDVTLFDRLSLAFIVKDKVELLPLSQLPYAAENGFVNGDTLYFNNLVQTKAELESNWIIPVKNSWLARKIEFSGPVS